MKSGICYIKNKLGSRGGRKFNWEISDKICLKVIGFIVRIKKTFGRVESKYGVQDLRRHIFFQLCEDISSLKGSKVLGFSYVS